MKKLATLLVVCLCVSGCMNSEKHPSDWKPTPYHVPVECCMETDQVQGAIRTALIKRNWTVLDVEDNKVYAHISCGWTDADVIFSSTDKYYDVTFENIMEEEVKEVVAEETVEETAEETMEVAEEATEEVVEGEKAE